jgi:hypothetical protein
MLLTNILILSGLFQKREKGKNKKKNLHWCSWEFNIGWRCRFPIKGLLHFQFGVEVVNVVLNKSRMILGE